MEARILRIISGSKRVKGNKTRSVFFRQTESGSLTYLALRYPSAILAFIFAGRGSRVLEDKLSVQVGEVIRAGDDLTGGREAQSRSPSYRFFCEIILRADGYRKAIYGEENSRCPLGYLDT